MPSTKKTLATFLSCLFAFSLFSTQAFADDEEQPVVENGDEITADDGAGSFDNVFSEMKSIADDGQEGDAEDENEPVDENDGEGNEAGDEGDGNEAGDEGDGEADGDENVTFDRHAAVPEEIDGEDEEDLLRGADIQFGLKSISTPTSTSDIQLVPDPMGNNFADAGFSLVFGGSDSNWRYLVDEGQSVNPAISLHYYGEAGDTVISSDEYTLQVQREEINGKDVSYVDASLPLTHGSTGHATYRVSAVAKSGSSFTGQTAFERGVIEVWSKKSLTPFGSTVSFSSTYLKKSSFPYSTYEVTSGTTLNPTVKLLGTDMSSSQYGVSYLNTSTNNTVDSFPTDVGTYICKVTGKSPYYGTNDTVKVIVTAAQISGATVTGVAAKTYTGAELTQNPTVKMGDKILVPDRDYTLSYTKNINVGTATMKITGVNNYKGAKNVKFKIKKAANPMTVKGASVKLDYKALKSKAASITGAITVKNAQGTVTYTNVSKAKVPKKFKVDAKTGKIVVQKKTPKGTYTTKVKVSAQNSANYSAKSKTVTVKIKVK